MRDQGDLEVLRKRVIAWWGQYGERFTERTRIWCLLEKKNCSREILVPPERTLWRASSLDGPSLPRGFPFELEVQPPNTPPGALARVPPLGASPSAPAEIPPPSTSPSVLAVSSNLERSRPHTSSSGLEILRSSLSPSILVVVLPSVTPCTLVVQNHLVPLTLLRAFPVHRSFRKGSLAAPQQ